MNLEQLKLLAEQRETKAIELKSSTASLRGAFESVCAFLNGEGGTVLIGVKDHGKLVGQEISDATRLDIAREIKRIEPSGSIHVDYVELKKEKFVIVIQVPAGEHAPYVYDGRPFERHESGTDKMSRHRYEQLLINRNQFDHAWEEATAVGYTLDDLDHEEIYKTIADGIRESRIPASAQREDVTTILERLSLLKEGELKRAAVVLYANQDSLKLVQCMIKMARFQGIDKLGNFIDNQQIYGNAFRILEEADAFLRRHLPIASFFKSDQFKRIDKPALPVLAVREALINAICHRDYADLTTDIALAIYDDRLEIWNSGSLLKKLTVDDLKQFHQSVLRNKLIANVFYVRGLIEKWGTGTNKMISLCKQDDIPEPKFNEEFGGLSVAFDFKEPIGAILIMTEAEGASRADLRQKLILNFMRKETKATIQQIHDCLTGKFPAMPARKTIIRDLNHLKSLGLLDSKGEKKGVVWLLKKKV